MLLFSYGSNLAVDEMDRWCPGARFVEPARLDGYRLAFTRRSIRWRGGVADIVPAAEAHVWGAAYEVEQADLVALDAKEGAGAAYRRCGVEVAIGGRVVAAQAYEVIDKAAHVAPPPAYLRLLVRGARERGLPAEWVSALEAMAPAVR